MRCWWVAVVLMGCGVSIEDSIDDSDVLPLDTDDAADNTEDSDPLDTDPVTEGECGDEPLSLELGRVGDVDAPDFDGFTPYADGDAMMIYNGAGGGFLANVTAHVNNAQASDSVLFLSFFVTVVDTTSGIVLATREQNLAIAETSPCEGHATLDPYLNTPPERFADSENWYELMDGEPIEILVDLVDTRGGKVSSVRSGEWDWVYIDRSYEKTP